jgi:hypothetical protein
MCLYQITFDELAWVAEVVSLLTLEYYPIED